MNYDANVFKAKANIKARRIWLVFSLLLTANYGTDAANGIYPKSSYIIFVALCWIPFFIGELFFRIKGKATDAYRLCLVIGYGIFYSHIFSRLWVFSFYIRTRNSWLTAVLLMYSLLLSVMCTDMLFSDAGLMQIWRITSYRLHVFFYVTSAMLCLSDT